MVSSQIFMFSYTLRGGERPAAYEQLARFIERNADDCKRVMESQWFVETRHTPEEWIAALRSVIDADDRFSITLARPIVGHLDIDVWVWLQRKTGAVSLM